MLHSYKDKSSAKEKNAWSLKEFDGALIKMGPPATGAKPPSPYCLELTMKDRTLSLAFESSVVLDQWATWFKEIENMVLGPSAARAKRDGGTAVAPKAASRRTSQALVSTEASKAAEEGDSAKLKTITDESRGKKDEAEARARMALKLAEEHEAEVERLSAAMRGQKDRAKIASYREARDLAKKEALAARKIYAEAMYDAEELAEQAAAAARIQGIYRMRQARSHMAGVRAQKKAAFAFGAGGAAGAGAGGHAKAFQVRTIAQTGDVEAFAKLGEGADVNGADADGITPLHFASARGAAELVAALVEAKATVNVADNTGKTPLINAAAGGHADTVDVLITKGEADVSMADEDGETAMHWAAAEGHDDVVAALAGTVAASTPNKEGLTPLMLAAAEGRTESIKILAAVPGVNVDAVDPSGRSALSYAKGAADVDALLEAGANVKHVDEARMSAGHWAAAEGRADALAQLLRARKKLGHTANGSGMTPLAAAAAGGHVECIRILMKHGGAKPNSPDHNGETPMHHAAANGHAHCVVELLLAGADDAARDKDGITPAMVAEEEGHTDILAILKNKAIVLNAAERRG